MTNSAQGFKRIVLSKPHPLLYTAEHLSKYISSLKHSCTPPSKDKSISSERQADGFEGRQCLCLRWEASDGGEQLSSRILVWAIPRCHPRARTHLPESLCWYQKHAATKRQFTAYWRMQKPTERGREMTEYFIHILSNWILDQRSLKMTPGDAEEAPCDLSLGARGEKMHMPWFQSELFRYKNAGGRKKTKAYCHSWVSAVVFSCFFADGKLTKGQCIKAANYAIPSILHFPPQLMR